MKQPIGAFELAVMNRKIDRKRVEIQTSRIDACDTLLDYLHDDIPWGMQEPFKKVIEQLKRNLEDEMQDALTP